MKRPWLLFLLLVNIFAVYGQAPSVTAVFPSTGLVGGLVTITGNNLSNATVTISGTPALILSVGTSQMVAMVMPGSTSGAIILSNTQGSSSPTFFSIGNGSAPSVQQGNRFTAT